MFLSLLVLASVACEEPEDLSWKDLVCEDSTFVNHISFGEAPQHCGKCGHACSRDDTCIEGKCVADRNFALWPIPTPPLTDEQYDIRKKTVVDLTTQLEWQRRVEDRVPDERAVDYCRTLELDGDGWRLPTYTELITIVDFSRRLPAINPVAFPDTPSSPFKFFDENTIWDLNREQTCSEKRQENGLKYCARQPAEDSQIDFSEGSDQFSPEEGSSEPNDKGLDDYVRCVRAGTPPESFDRKPHYDVETDTVLDRYTGLRWQRNLPQCAHASDCPGNALEDIDQATKYCEDLDLGGYDDWRLPNITELLSVSYMLNRDLPVDTVMRVDPEIFVEDAPDLTSSMWSATRWALSPSEGPPLVWTLDNLLLTIRQGRGAVRARCVRNE